MAAGVTSLFKKIDEFVFKQIDLLKNNRAYQAILAKLSELPQNQQLIVGQLLTFSVVLIPLVILTITFVGNYKLREEIEVRHNILHLLHQYSAQKTQMIELGNSMASHIPLTNNAEATQMLKEVVDRKKIDSKKVALTNFEMGSALKTLAMAEADISFKEFSINELTGFLQVLLQEKKSKISKINIQKDSEKNLLSGVVHIVHYSQSTGDYERQ